MTSLKVGRKCFPSNAWVTDTDEGQMWHSNGNFILAEVKDSLPVPMEFVRIYQPLAKDFGPVINGTVDFEPDLTSPNNVREDLKSLLDFSYPVHFGETINIISGKRSAFQGQIVLGVFDSLSYGLMLASLIGCLILVKSVSRQGWSTALIKVWAMLMRQGDMDKSRRIGVIPVLFFATFIGMMYYSVMLAMLTAKTNLRGIDNLDQLERSNLPIYMTERQKATITSITSRPKLRARVVDLDLSITPVGKVLTDVKAGTHVWVEVPSTIKFFFDFSLTPDFKCDLQLNDYYVGQEALFSFNFNAWVYKKDFEYQEFFDSAIMWTHAYGIGVRTWMLIQHALANKDGILIDKPLDFDPATCQGLNMPTIQRTENCPVEPGNEPLTLIHLEDAFFLWIIGMGVSIVIFLLEKFLFLHFMISFD